MIRSTGPELGAEMTDARARTNRRSPARRWSALASLIAIPALVAALASPTSAAPTQEGGIPDDANFTLAGISAKGETLTTGAVVNGDFSYCSNANGLGSELYFNASGPNGVSVHHATVSPLVIPLHIGLVTIVDPTNPEPIDGDFITLGVAEGTPAPFGSDEPSDAMYGGLVVSRAGIGVMSFNYSTGSSDCAESKVMPILEPYISGAQQPPQPPTTIETPTTEAPTTVPPTTAPPTTAPPTTAPPTTAAPTTAAPTTAPPTTAPPTSAP